MGLFICLYFLFFFSFVTCSSAQFCPPDQKSALLQFKSSFNCTSVSKITSWNNETDCCSWNGISCDESNVIGVDLSDGGLCGTLHSNSSLFHLTHLQKLELNADDGSDIRGYFGGPPGSRKIPHALGQLASLTHLTLTSFAGSVPREISSLSKLVSLDLSGSDLSFDTPTIIRMVQNVTNIKEMNFHVDMSKVAPSAFINLSSSLTSLDITGCRLGEQHGGEFPVNVMKLPNLRLLSLSYNPMTGRFPYSNWSSPLKSIDIYATGFSFVLPESIGNLKSLESLNLGGCLYGELPKSIGNLRSLKQLQLTGNNFTGTIPTSLGNLTELTDLGLGHNNFNGEFPSSFSKLEKLTELDLSFNNFSGQFPDAFTNVTKLSMIIIPGNRFSGLLPLSLFNLTNLFKIDFSSNQLEGPIPSKVSVNPYSSVAIVSLSDNLLRGSVPSWILSLPNLESLDLNMNKLDGRIEEFLIDSSQLGSIDISNNELHGRFPKSLFRIKNLFSLSLASNKLIDSIDQEMISKLQNLQHLDLSDNNIVFTPNTNANFTLPMLTTLNLASCNINEIPNFIKNSDQISMLDLSNNSIQGHVPEWFWSVGENSLEHLNFSHNFLQSFNRFPWKLQSFIIDISSNLIQGRLPVLLPRASVFIVSNNKYTGALPSSLCNMTYLAIVDLSNNTFNGILPKCLGNFSDQITVLKLGQNNFHGKIPTTFANTGRLSNLGLNGNQLEGELPRSLSNCKKLEILDVGNNKINGTFPYWLETLPLLHVLVLRSNMFHGPINKSRTKSPFPKLRIMDLSHNAFTGALPSRYFETMKAMMSIERNEVELKYLGGDYYEASVKITMKGFDFELVKILTIFTTIDLSNNSFEGGIPKSIGRVEALKGLNVSHNKLNGEIPSSIGNLRSIEWLDLSSNELIGEIPIELVGLTSLAVLNLSHNQLVGRIPTGQQFNTFENNSYASNLGLCGFPLSKLCGPDGTVQQSSLPRFEDESTNFIFELGWEIVMMGYGCGTIVGIGIGYLVFRYGKPKCIVRLVEGKQPIKSKRSRDNTPKRAGRRN